MPATFAASIRRAVTGPLDPTKAMAYAKATLAEAEAHASAAPLDLDQGLSLVEKAVARFRQAFTSVGAPEAAAAVAYHERAEAELAEDFSPLFYREAVLRSVAARYAKVAAAIA